MSKAHEIFRSETRLNQGKIDKLRSQVAKGMQKALYNMDDLDVYLSESAGGITDLIFELNQVVGDDYQDDLERTLTELREIQQVLKEQHRFLRDTQRDYQRIG